MIARRPDADRPLLALLDAMEAGRAGNAERKAGAMLKAMEKNKGGRPAEKTAGTTPEVSTPSLADLGVTEDQSRRWQREASADAAKRQPHVAKGESRRAAKVVDHDDPPPSREKKHIAREARAAEAHVTEKTPPRRHGGHRRPLPVPAAPPGVTTVEDLLRRYAVRRRLSPRTIDLYRITLRHFGEHLGHEPTVDDLDDDIVSEFLLWRAGQSCRGRKVSPASVEKDRVQILAVWRYGARKRLVREFPDVGAWKVPRRVKPAYTADDLERLVAAARAYRGDDAMTGGKPRGWWFSTIILAAFQTGERKGGLLGLRWRDVDLDRCVVTFRAETRKGGREDMVRGITPALAEELRQHQGADDDFVWPWCGCDVGHYPILEKLCRRAGVPYLALHAIRRTSASYVARGGGDASAHLGHASPQTTKDHYLVAEITQARAGLEFLPRIGEANKQQ